jgi:hypothetical protein
MMNEYVDSMTAEGGGDGPEAVADALYEVLKMEWRGGERLCVCV